MSTKRHLILAILVVAGGLAVVVASLSLGTEPLSLNDMIREWQSGGPLRESPTLSILVYQRLPRTLAAFLAGSALALVGACFQGMLRNPLATPYTLGIASAGAFGAWAATIAVQILRNQAAGDLGPAMGLLRTVVVDSSAWGVSAIQLGAFAFALLDVAIIYLLATRRMHMSPAVLLLTGVTLGMLANAGILFMRYFASPEKLLVMDRWLMGGVDIVGYAPVRTLAIGVIPCTVILLLQASKLDQLGFSVELAASRGVNVKRLHAVVFLVGSIVTAMVASTVGPIGFIGLIVPHSVRAITGSRHRVLLPLTVFAGGAFLCLCDIIARRLLTGETPIGIITALFGGPFFLYLLTRRRFTDWD